MSTAQQLADLPSFAVRREQDGCVVYADGAGIYLFAEDAAFPVLGMIRSLATAGPGRGLPEEDTPRAEDLLRELQTRFGLDDEGTRLWLARLASLLRAEAVTLPAPQENFPLVCPLEDVVGENASRCSTFGMPL
ncbi:Uncharacterised protein [Mycobacterium tuberculosis]|nr:Uncharacterised protein [Mycobacterium tuberculosis]